MQLSMTSYRKYLSNNVPPVCCLTAYIKAEIVFSKKCKNEGCNKIHCLCTEIEEVRQQAYLKRLHKLQFNINSYEGLIKIPYLFK